MQRQRVPHPISFFCVAAPADQDLLAQWETHLLPLQQAGLFTFWSERALHTGDTRMEQFTKHLEQADVIVMLLSADFFASEECLILMDHALHRLRDGVAQVTPLLVRPVHWRESPLGTLVCLPANSIPVLSWEYQDEQVAGRRF